MRISTKCLALFISVIMVVTVMPALLVSAADYTEDFSDCAEGTTFTAGQYTYITDNGIDTNADYTSYDASKISGGGWGFKPGTGVVATITDGALKFDHSAAAAENYDYVYYATDGAIKESVEIEFDYNFTCIASLKEIVKITGIDKNVFHPYSGYLCAGNARDTSSWDATADKRFAQSGRAYIKVDYSTGTISVGANDRISETTVITFDTEQAVTGLKFTFGPTWAANTGLYSIDNVSIKTLAAAPVALSCELNGTTATTTFNSAAVADFTDDSVYLVTGLYDANDKLLQVVAGVETLTDGTATHTANFTAADGAYVKVFAWDATDKLTPITASVTEPLS